VKEIARRAHRIVPVATASWWGDEEPASFGSRRNTMNNNNNNNNPAKTDPSKQGQSTVQPIRDEQGKLASATGMTLDDADTA
jgi:hypothetical protein